MKHVLFVVGSLKSSWVKDGCKQYLDRLSIDVVELPASKQKDWVQQVEEESERILKGLGQGKGKGQVWLFDERGEVMTSLEFAEQLSALQDLGESITFVLGGAYGVNDAVRSVATRVIRFSDMVFPHELARVLILEQLYRAQQIQRGSGYHH